MKEFSITLQKNGYALLTRDPWNPNCTEETDVSHDGKTINSRPYLYEPGMKVVDIFGNVVTISEIYKFVPSSPGQMPEWCIYVKESENGYAPRELAGILVRDNIPPYEVEAFIQGL